MKPHYNEDSYSNISYNIKKKVNDLLPHNKCLCVGDKSLMPEVNVQVMLEVLQASDLEELKSRRAQEYDKFKNRTRTAADLLIVAEANSPLQYPTQGVEVQPLKTILIPGLGLHEPPKELHSVNLRANLGTFDVAAEVQEVMVEGVGEKHMTLSSSSLPHLNRQLQFVTYTSKLFHSNTADKVDFETKGYKAVFVIKVRHRLIPKLYNPGRKGVTNINNLVTIATKTFLRYNRLKTMIDSVRKFYPSVTIVIADDSENPEKVTGPYIEHYIMPFGKGWFAGRNLAISQVATKYVLWVDDDFVFTSETNIEKLVEVLENTELDVVGGAVRRWSGQPNTYQFTINLQDGDEDGDCLHLQSGFYHTIAGFPRCVFTDAVVNFFLARTDKVRQVGFDLNFARIGHLEFFIDGLGSLYVGSCDDVVISHPALNHGQKYNSFRYPSENARFNHTILFYFKNRLQCVSRA
ncbi:beta-1,4 N-acetylgalactosaminyltransferase 1-like isoform X1 [Arapaima gigas]